MKKMKIMRCDAMLTVEAAFLIPFFIIVIVYCIFLTFHLYNSNITFQSAYLATLRSSLQTTASNQDRYNFTSTEFSSSVEKQLIACEQCYQKVEAGVGYVQLEYQLQTICPFSVDFLNQDHLTNMDRVKSYVIDPVTFIRTYRSAQRLISGGEDYGNITGDEKGY